MCHKNTILQLVSHGRDSQKPLTGLYTNAPKDYSSASFQFPIINNKLC